MPGELGRDWSLLPLLPAGSPLFESLPVRALVLDALAPAIGNGLITMLENGSEGVLVVRDGVVAERVWVVNGVRRHGDEALAFMRSADAAMVSARRLDDEATDLLGVLLHGSPCYSDLRLEWVAWPQFLSELCARGETFAVEVQTPAGRGVTFIQRGHQAATFTESHPALGDVSLLDDLAAGGVGTIRVLRDESAVNKVSLVPVVALSVADDAARVQTSAAVALEPAWVEYVADATTPEAARPALFEPARARIVANAAHSEAVRPLAAESGQAGIVANAADSAASMPLALLPAERGQPYVLPAARELAPPGSSRPLVVATVEANSTFSAMFGPHDFTPENRRLIALDNAPHSAERDVTSVLPQLRLLVQHRLQRSSASVEAIVEVAATDHQSVGWLADRVRVMTMRGFLPSTFDQLADDMLALAGRDPD